MLFVSLHWASKVTLHKKATIHLATTMLDTSKNVLFPGHNHQYWWPDILIIIVKVKGHKYQWLAGGYDQGIGHF